MQTGLLFAQAHRRDQLCHFSPVDGTKGAPCVFDSCDEEAVAAAPVRAMTLESSEVLEDGGMWLRYRLSGT
jgi:hypothetical protein